MFFTIFTPTYNRATLLSRLYQSLCEQEYKDFEWLIVDDGSSDHTFVLVQEFIAENKIDIRYIYQDNGGKHRAINKGVKEAKGEFFFIADSDDWLNHNSLKIASKYCLEIKNKKDIAGVCGRDADSTGKLIGQPFPFTTKLSTSLSIDFKEKLQADMKEIFKTNILRQYPFPEIENERFCPEAIVWYRIASQYQLLFFNEIIYIAEYQQGGLTDYITKVRRKSPIASMICYSELLQYDIPFFSKIKATINFWRFKCCNHSSFHLSIAYWGYLTYPIGWLLYQYDTYRLKKKNI